MPDRKMGPVRVPAGVLPIPLLVGVALAGCGAKNTNGAASNTTHAAPVSVHPIALRLSATVKLPQAVQLPAVAPYGTGALSLGGLDSADGSLAETVLIGDGATRRFGELPSAEHDGAAANIDGQVYFFGGGNVSSASSLILRVGPSGTQVAGHLPVGASDVEAATLGHTAYVVGGYTETVPLRTIVAFTPAGTVRVVGTLPRPLRYAAVGAIDGHLLIAGGTSGVTAQRAILSFDPNTASVRQIGLLPYPITHAAGATLDGHFYLFGGRGENLSEQRSSILAIDPLSGASRPAGRLPLALSDLGAASLPGRILVVGGRDPSGEVQDRVLTFKASG
ncbi:MAG TPA: kelch repeat-containing protein [Solirubrobacteraceae bacterium]